MEPKLNGESAYVKFNFSDVTYAENLDMLGPEQWLIFHGMTSIELVLHEVPLDQRLIEI